MMRGGDIPRKKWGLEGHLKMRPQDIGRQVPTSTLVLGFVG